MKNEILEVLKKSKISTQKDVAVLIITNDYEAKSRTAHISQSIVNEGSWLHLIQGTEVITLILPEKHVNLVKEVLKGKVLSTREGLVQILIKSPSSIYTVPGVIAHITTLLANQGVNIIEFLSCYTDTIVIIESDSVVKALDVLSK